MKMIGYMRITPNYGFGSILVCDNGQWINHLRLLDRSTKRLLHQIIVSQVRRNLQALLYSYPSSPKHLLCNASTFIRGRVKQSYRALPEENQPGSNILLELDDNWFAIFQFFVCFLNMRGVSWVYILGRNNSLVLQL